MSIVITPAVVYFARILRMLLCPTMDEISLQYFIFSHLSAIHFINLAQMLTKLNYFCKHRWFLLVLILTAALDCTKGTNIQNSTSNNFTEQNLSTDDVVIDIFAEHNYCLLDGTCFIIAVLHICARDLAI